MSAKPDGGAAFPRPYGYNGFTTTNGHADSKPQDGMSLRDYFAGQALAGIPKVIQLSADCSVETSVDAAAEYAYRVADAMLAERAK